MIPKRKTKKKKSLSTVIEKLDTVFSQFIRLRDSDQNGYCRCISCGKVVFWKYIQNGHFVNRGHMNTRFDEKNCNAQCVTCNCFDEGNNIGYMRGLIDKYGPRIIDELYIKKNQTKKWDAFDLEVLIQDYQKKVDRLKLEKSL